MIDMGIDKEVIKEGLANLESQIKSLREKREFSLEEYKRNEDLQAIVERRLQNAIQACIDLGMHIASEKGSRKPEDYGDIFVILGEMNIINTKLSKEMVEKAGFRNVLAHDYSKIIDKEVYRHLQNLEVFEKFAKEVNNFLKKIE